MTTLPFPLIYFIYKILTNRYSEMHGVPYVPVKDSTKAKPFNLSASNYGTKTHQHHHHEEPSSPRFQTSIDKSPRHERWPSSSDGDKGVKRRSQSADFIRNKNNETQLNEG
jgi:hypothetical protein